MIVFMVLVYLEEWVCCYELGMNDFIVKLVKFVEL